MYVSEISLWGAALVACVVFVAMIALAFFDSKMLRRMLVICSMPVCCWGAFLHLKACSSSFC